MGAVRPEPNLNPRELIRLARFSTRWDKLSLLAHETCQTVSILLTTIPLQDLNLQAVGGDIGLVARLLYISTRLPKATVGDNALPEV